MEFKEAAHEAAAALSGPQASWGELDRAREILLLAGDPAGAAKAARRLGQMARAQGQEREGAGDAGGALTAWFDAATAFGRAGDPREAQESALRFLSLWGAFESSKRIDLQPSRPAVAADAPKRLRRLPKGDAPAKGPPGPASVEEPAVGGAFVLPAMFLEMHASALRLAGNEREAKRQFEEAQVAIAGEVARRREAQQWGEALEAARGLSRVALEAGGRPGLDAVRPDLIALAREAAFEALTPDYFARGRDRVPQQAIEWALLEAHALGNESLAHKYEEEAATVLERTADLTEALVDPRTAAEAVLAWEDAWPMLATRGELRRALLTDPEALEAWTGPFSSIAGMARSHPLRREVEDFRDRVEEAVARARAAAPRALEQAAQALLPSDPNRARPLAERARRLDEAAGGPAPESLLVLIRDAYLALGAAAEARRVHLELLDRAGPPASLEGRLRREALAAELAAGGRLAARAQPALVAWASFLVAEGGAAWRRGDARQAGLRFEEAAALGHPQARSWLRLMELGGPPSRQVRSS